MTTRRMARAADSCVGPELLQGFVSGTLEPDDAERVEQHLDLCAACRAALGELTHGSGTTQGLATLTLANDAGTRDGADASNYVVVESWCGLAGLYNGDDVHAGAGGRHRQSLGGRALAVRV